MHNTHSKNTVRYYVLIVLFFVFLFFSNDFGWIDVQKTAIVTAVGIDRQQDDFILTSQIAVPQSSKQGKASEAVQIVSRGKTIADAFDEINAKTGWYPKLVFCNLILLGENTAKSNVFDALDYFLRDEYLSDNCMLATCDGFAKDLLNSTALVDSTNSMAMEKVLSSHAKRVGSVLPTTLKDFSIGYFSNSRCGFLPILKTQPQQEQIPSASDSSNDSGSTENQSSSVENSSSEHGENSSSANSGNSGNSEQSTDDKQSQQKEKSVFSAGETALFLDGKRVGKFTKEETFAFSAVTNKLRLASYSVPQESATCTLNIRQNSSKTKLIVGKDKRVCLSIRVTLTAGVLDYSKSQDLAQINDAGDLPNGIFPLAEKKLATDITQVFEKCKSLQCDLFGIVERLEKYEKKHFSHLRDTALGGAIADVTVQFRSVR